MNNLFTAKAFAKINLCLQVLNKRTDNYHNINTVFTLCKLSDEITIYESDSFQIECYPSLNIPENENIIFKAAKLFFSKYKTNDFPFKIILQKRIPTGAGLGGGSSDAASVIIALRQLLKLDYNYKELKEIALSLGSDVPFFLKKGTAVATGRGEKLSYFRYSLPYSILLVSPNIHIDTAWAYKILDKGMKPEKAIDFHSVIINSIKEPKLLQNILFNDFEKPVFEQYPIIPEIKDKLYSSGAVYAQMSGSGSTVFGFFGNIEKATKASTLFPEFKTFIS